METWDSVLQTYPIDKRIVFLQYNTHLFEGTAIVNLESGAEVVVDALSNTTMPGMIVNELRKKLTKKNIVNQVGGIDQLILEDDKRKFEIVAKIKDLDPDIVALNEVWSPANQKWFAEQLKVKDKLPFLPYHAFGPEHSVGCQSSGLVLLSKFQIKQVSRLIFQRKGNEAGNLNEEQKERQKLLDDMKFEEKHANKGVLMAEIYRSDGKRFLISISHTAGFVDIAELIDYTKETAQKTANDCAIIIAGDLNVHQNEIEESDLSKHMINMFAEDLSAQDVWSICQHFEDKKGNTINNVENMLFRKLHPTRQPRADSYSEVDRLDYVFFSSSKPNSNEAKLTPIAARVITDWTVKAKINDKLVDLDLSDHYPLQVLFGIE